jgi:threonine dehydrogenase-like Zn-dependent dehydrogenase
VSLIDELVERGEIGGRTVRVLEGGEVDCHAYPVAARPPGTVRVRSVKTAISPGTELTYLGAAATNPYLHRRWDPDLRLFVQAPPAHSYPIVFGYRAAGIVVESDDPQVREGTRVWGRWRHTEFTVLSLEDARRQVLPAELSIDDALDLGQMLPIAVNAVAFAEERHVGSPTAVFGCGPIGLLVAQVARATGASRVYAADRLDRRLEVARSLGLEAVIADGDVAASLKRAHGADGVPVAFECSGSYAALHEAVRTVQRQGLVVAVGFYQGGAEALRLGEEFHHNGVAIRSAQIGNLHPRYDARTIRSRAVELARSGALVLGRLPRTEVPVERAAEGFAAFRRPNDVLQVALTY